MAKQPSLKIAKLSALITFLGGTLIFLLYFFTDDKTFLFTGVIYTAIVGLINLGIFTALLIRGYKETENRRKIILTCGLMVLNLPVVLFYCWFGMKLLNTMRVTLINTTQIELTDIKIIGCEPKQINKLVPGESETVWIAIAGDCSIIIEYVTNGHKRIEIVAGYCTANTGKRLTHKIESTQ